MSKYMEEAKKVLAKANDEFNLISNEFSTHYNEEFQDAHEVYLTAIQLNVLTSQLVDKNSNKVYEGPIKIDNMRAIVTIDSLDIRINIRFEIMQNGIWLSGHHESSQYGQIFVSNQGSLILSEDITGRVTLPLTLDKF